MIALLSLIYGSFYFLFFKKLKWFVESVKNISIFVGIGVVMIGAIVFAWWTFAPTAVDGRGFQYVIPIVPNVAGQVIEVREVRRACTDVARVVARDRPSIDCVVKLYLANLSS